MNIFLTFAYLFFIGSLLGWGIELIYRRFFDPENPKKKWINPGFCKGPYLPIYGVGLCILYLIASFGSELFEINTLPLRVLLFIIMAFCMTVIELIGGIFLLKVFKLRLWDYRNEWLNLKGLICPKYSFFWAVLGGIYYFAIHPYILNALDWLANNLAFSFVIGFFFGVFVLDLAGAMQLGARLKRYAEENNVIVRYESIKAHIRNRHEERREKYHFFIPFKSTHPLSEYLSQIVDSFEKRKRK